MRTRLRLGAAASIGLGALLLATVLASPALAWHSNVTVSARCLDNGKVRIHYTVEAWEEGHNATVDVAYKLNGELTELESEEHFFAPGHDRFSGQFNLPAGTTGEITIIAVAHWENGDKSHNKGSAELPPADKCGGDSGSTTTTAPPTTAPPTTAPSTTEAPTTTAPSSTVAPSSTQQPTTTAAVGAATSTTGGGQLPFTGAGSSQPMLLAGIALVGGGALFLLLSRERRATR
ncbi:MAG TPA: hypothetical protein VHS79_02845 [Actinomycetes bacterium]|jgi:hypothetical protein|nr:hypothetical protein [Actinomycetes bacterium]HEV3462897.1 hypothetical protein [Actinomycetota bacterium]HEV3498507.1 hypothetical protein [Actinomycetes bacterium]HEX2155914.1 hypothetical protein [Actinomycetes bacterium]